MFQLLTAGLRRRVAAPLALVMLLGPIGPATAAPDSGKGAASAASTAGSGASPAHPGNAAARPPTLPDGLVPLIPGGHPMHGPQAARLYGPGAWIMDGLWNIDAKRNGNQDQLAGIRFRAPADGKLASIKLYWSDGRGYAGGNGGVIKIELRADDNTPRHLPDWKQPPLGTGLRVPGSLGMVDAVYGTPANRFAPDKLSQSTPLKAGQLYHLIAYNTAADPVANWSSWDMQWTLTANGLPARWLNTLDFAALAGVRPAGSDENTAPTWSDWTVEGHNGAYVVPIAQLTMEDGRSFGNSNLETGNVVVGDRAWQNNSDHPVRERFKPTASRTITGLSLQTALISGSGGLGWKILQGSTELAAGTITQASANVVLDTSVSKSKTMVLTWYDVALPSPVTFSPGTTYDVEFTPQQSSVWAFVDQRNGLAQGFTPPAAFTESQAQVSQYGLWFDANHWAHSSVDTRVMRWVTGGANLGSNWRVVLHTK